MCCRKNYLQLIPCDALEQASNIIVLFSKLDSEDLDVTLLVEYLCKTELLNCHRCCKSSHAGNVS